MDRLQDLVIIVTGGAHGIGRAYCEGLAKEGARVVVADIDGPGAEAVAQSRGEDGHDALAVAADVSVQDDTDRMAAETVARFGRIDGLINNAAVFQRPGMSRGPFEQISVDEWDRLMAPGLTMSMDEIDDVRMARNQTRIQARSIKRSEVPQDLVGTVVFLCSTDSDFMTGQSPVVDGGAQMH